ncbi:MAG: lytic transglycosylase domain-containing protein [Pyrinomonadaceae bacterium]
MIRSSLIILAIATLSVGAAAQNRVFDNFDRSQGVNVHMPPPPEPMPVAKRVKRNGRWVVITEDPLVKKTVSSRPTQSPADGLATRDRGYNPNGTRLSMGSSTHLKGFTTGVPEHDRYIVESSQRYRIDPLLIYSQMHQESSFKIRATSNKGASGLMQLMPATARRFGVTKIYDPQQNIDAGVKYMRWLLDTFNQDVRLALAGYNAGEGAVMKYGWSIPPYRETQEYVRRISDRYSMISDGRYVNTARKVNENTARVIQKEAAPLNAFEVAPIAIRTSDGKMMLVNQ